MKSSQRSFVKTYVALAILGGIGAYIYFVESKRPETPEKAKPKVFASFDKAKATTLTLAPKDGETIRVAKESGAWKLKAPSEAPADGPEIDALLSSVANLEQDEVVAEGSPKLADFGLESPRLTVSTLVEGQSEPFTLLLGDKSPDGGSVYAMLPKQNKVFTIASYLETGFQKKPFDLRDRDVLHVKRDAVKTLEVAGADGGFALARDDKGEWSFTQPFATRAGRWSVDGLLGTLEGLRMESVAGEASGDKQLKTYGLDKPARTLTLGLADGVSKVLEIGSAADKKEPAKPEPKPAPKPSASPSPEKPTKYYAWAKDSGQVVVIPAALVDDLAKGMKEYRAKRLLDVATYDVEGVEVEADGAKRVYTRATSKDKDGVDQHKWKRTTPDAKDLDTNKVQDVLFKIGGLEAQDFIDKPAAPESYGLDKPAIKVTLKMGAGKPSPSFEIAIKDNQAYARRDGDASLLELDAAKAQELAKAFKEL